MNTPAPILRLAVLLALAAACAAQAQAQAWKDFSSKGLHRSKGVVVRVSHPPEWKKVEADDLLALAELQGPHGDLTGILQIARGGRRSDMEAACRPENAQTLLQGLAGDEAGTRVTDVFARKHQDRPAFEVRYERQAASEFTLVRSVIVCLRDSKLLVSCGAMGRQQAALAAIEPVCGKVLDTLDITEE